MDALVQNSIIALAELEGVSAQVIMERLQDGCAATESMIFKLCAVAAAQLAA